MNPVIVELRNPPSAPVPWTVTRRDGTIGTKVAQTAWQAVKQLRWSFQDCIDFKEETPRDRT